MLATREELRPSISPRYSFARHLVWLHLFTLGAIAGALFALRAPRLGELATVPATFVFANAIEYFFHRYPMHHRWPLFGLLFSRHTVHHHAYFRAGSMKVGDARDMRFVLFPAYASLLVIALTALGGSLLALALGRNVGLIFLATATFYYLLYEWFHASFHLVREETLERIPLVGKAALRHRLHHDPERMTAINFNITFAWVDRIVGTKADT